MIKSIRGFSLIEVTLSLGVLAVALVAIFGLMPVGMTASRDAANDTQVSLIADDACSRVRYYTNRGIYFDGTFARVPLTSGPSPVPTPVPLPTPWTVDAAGTQSISWFYDVNGQYRTEADAGTYSNTYYRVDVNFGATWNAIGTSPTPNPGFLRPVTIKISWPTDTSSGVVIGGASKSVTFSVRKP